jgi:hypothetical protein
LADAYLRLGKPQQAMAAALTGLRYGARPNYRMIIVNITHATKPALAAGQIAECLKESPTEPACRAAFAEMISGHPRASEYRALFATLAQREGFAFLPRRESQR